jgi:hypothetical protein
LRGGRWGAVELCALLLAFQLALQPLGFVADRAQRLGLDAEAGVCRQSLGGSVDRERREERIPGSDPVEDAVDDDAAVAVVADAADDRAVTIRLSLGKIWATCSIGISSKRRPSSPARTSSNSGSIEARKRTPCTVPIRPSGDSTRKPSQRCSQ